MRLLKLNILTDKTLRRQLDETRNAQAKEDLIAIQHLEKEHEKRRALDKAIIQNLLNKNNLLISRTR